MDVSGVERTEVGCWLTLKRKLAGLGKLAKARTAFAALPWDDNKLDICEIPAIVVAGHLIDVHEGRWQ